ncbi:MAG: hypothetical protein K9M10_01610 [Candidatus Pacebacteria bacterium]|nr:hypothetical protein [Candidatus Paceibacterota bacterium]MCF7857160.1 hypothetical protein [Candidatus Paceibacterota bacterium]
MHHANLLIGETDQALAQVPLEDKVPGADVSVIQHDKLTIAHVRALTHEANMRPINRTYRSFVIVCSSILREAQNALLKLFEEPNSHTIFYLIMPRADGLLPTLLSRLHRMVIEEENVKIFQEFEKFKVAQYKDRLIHITQILDSDDATKLVQEIVMGLSLYAHTQKNLDLMRDVLILESYIHTNGSSKKMLLEHIALTLPLGT